MQSDSINTLASKYLELEGFDIVLKKDWASTKDTSRADLRQYIFDNISSEPSILDLSHTPVLKDFNLSISHNKEMGGFAIISQSAPKSSIKAFSLGFDIEINSRAKPDLVSRVSVCKQEFDSAPSPCALWTAKEAAFKCLSGELQPAGVADIEIGNWRCVEKGVFLCEIIHVSNQSIPNNSGLVVSDSKQSTAIFVLKSKNMQTEGTCVGF